MTRRPRWKKWRQSNLEFSRPRRSGGWASLKGGLGELLLFINCVFHCHPISVSEKMEDVALATVQSATNLIVCCGSIGTTYFKSNSNSNICNICLFYRFPEVYEGGRPKLGGLMDPRQGAVDRQSRFQPKTKTIYDIIIHLLFLVHLLRLTRVTSVKSSWYHHSAESHRSSQC